MGMVAQTIVPSAKFCLGYADATLKDVKAADFGKMPKGVVTNSPAFVFGHLGVYPDRLLEAVGRGELAKPIAKHLDLFVKGKECVDDPNGTIYPPMEELVSRFRERHEVLLGVLSELTDGDFAKTNPNEAMRERFPTVGILANFLLSGHMMMHLGQVSVWRRCMGLGPCM
jgi:hypothetical protein